MRKYRLQMQKNKERWDLFKKIFGYFFFPVCLFGGSCVGVTTNLLTTENDWVKACWSWHLRLIYIIPGITYEIAFIKNYNRTIRKAITFRVALEIFFSPFLHFAYALGLIYGAVVLI